MVWRISMEINEVILEIKCINGVFPEKEIEFLIKNKKKAIPKLLNVLKNAYIDPDNISETKDYFVHMYAAFLLAQFREKRGYTLMYNILTMETPIVDFLYGDILSEDMHRILASLSRGDISLIKKIIEDYDIDDRTKSSALRALIVLVARKEKSRKEILEYLKILYTNIFEREVSLIWTTLVRCTYHLHPKDLMGDIIKVYEEGLVDGSDISIEDLEEQCKLDSDEVLKKLETNKSMTYIEDTVNEFKGWACFRN